jgi:hypothetical protein
MAPFSGAIFILTDGENIVAVLPTFSNITQKS